MKQYSLLLAIVMAASCGKEKTPTAPTGPIVSFFVTSATSVTGNLGGLAGADATCQRLAAAAGHGGPMWRAYLSVERDPSNGNQPTHARDRIGTGPWYNANLTLVANNPSCTRARVMPPCSSTSAANGSTANGQAPRRRSNTTSSRDRTLMAPWQRA
jgi:hypothetical protein